ncbi:MAG TPA: adenylyl-sulfate kinase [Candidatus Paceibacterota bacterium]|nr:adenylyl-sulfate kinase [Candidatus Paceibacterota bacterium]
MEHTPASLFVGRWQPFHEGHKKLIETVLRQDKPVVIAIRDTPMSASNPYTIAEREEKIREALRAYEPLVSIIVIPDIDEICYGRDVGYAIRRIELDAETEKISGTKIRAAGHALKPVIWLTGQSGAGKSTIAELVKDELGAVVLDGDEMRESISLGAGFSREERDAHNLRVARLAFTLARQKPVIVSVIAPFEDTRATIDALLKPLWIYIKKDIPASPERPYELPATPDLTLDSDAHTPQENARELLAYLRAPERSFGL